MGTAEEKKALRAFCLARRLALSKEEKARADARLCRAVAAHPAFLDADLILTYSPVRGEPDLSPLTALALAKGKRVAYPRCEGKTLVFHTVMGLDDLSPDKFGIPAPQKDAPVARPTKKTLCLLPGLAAGKDGTRLGFGGGFYDRFLPSFEGVTLFPVYEALLFPTLPTEETDRTFDFCVTDKTV